ncbi:hypothetical protein GMST_39110 [Geomonas silvestris]|uniref:Chromosome condensation regulator RCC1 n=1 Tax=Geomonas silvestris TaxID=2740184 RepID=A0A6V8MNG4_9BACT|nr:hypothetical protein GMST_39110 [Geomonas silvestris]
MLVVALISGCGSSSNKTIPSSTTIWYGHSLVFRGYTTLTAGYNGFGQLGVGNLDNQAALVKVAGLGRVDGAALGADHTVAFSFANISTVYAWGSNYHGQLGSAVTTSGTQAYSPTPVKVHGFGGGTVSAVAAGAFHSLALVNGNVYTWGYNGNGQLGNGNYSDTSIPSPVIVAGSTSIPINNIVQVVAGGTFSAALTADGKVYTWGNNDKGQLGRIPTSPFASDNTADLVQLDGGSGHANTLTNIKKIAAGGSTCYALSNDNTTVYAWGYNGSGQIGRNPFSNITTAQNTIVPGTSSVVPFTINLSAFLGGTNNVTITDISAGLEHVLVLLSDGSVVSWGFNGFAQAGRNVTPSSTDPQGLGVVRFPTPGYVRFDNTTNVQGSGDPAHDVTKILAVGNHSLAFRSTTGKWYGWGDNGYGQLGNPIATSSAGYIQVPSLVAGY